MLAGGRGVSISDICQIVIAFGFLATAITLLLQSRRLYLTSTVLQDLGEQLGEQIKRMATGSGEPE